MSFGPTIIQEPAHLNYRPPPLEIDTAGTDHRDNEVYWLNRDYREDEMLREAGHND